MSATPNQSSDLPQPSPGPRSQPLPGSTPQSAGSTSLAGSASPIPDPTSPLASAPLASAPVASAPAASAPIGAQAAEPAPAVAQPGPTVTQPGPAADQIEFAVGQPWRPDFTPPPSWRNPRGRGQGSSEPQVDGVRSHYGQQNWPWDSVYGQESRAWGSATQAGPQTGGRQPGASRVTGDQGAGSRAGTQGGTQASSSRPQLVRLNHNPTPLADGHMPPAALMGGVCAGIATHLGVNVWLVRAIFVGLICLNGVGALAYALAIALIPAGNPASSQLAAPTRLAAQLNQLQSKDGRDQAATIFSGVVLLALAAILVAWSRGWLESNAYLPLLIIGCGAALAWSQAEEVMHTPRSMAAIARLAAGLALAVLGVLIWLSDHTDMSGMLIGAFAALVMLSVVALVLAPLWLGVIRQLSQTQAAQARASERADIAAHLHDSVLQTLTLLRAQADDPQRVAALALSQERELRAWLYGDNHPTNENLRSEVESVSREIEQLYGVPVDSVIVGDTPATAKTRVLTSALREALANAVRHGKPPISLYVEVSGQEVEAYVRDHGAGFELETINPDRHGVRDSIIGRMQRHGGSATIRAREPGTEVCLRLALQ